MPIHERLVLHEDNFNHENWLQNMVFSRQKELYSRNFPSAIFKHILQSKNCSAQYIHFHNIIMVFGLTYIHIKNFINWKAFYIYVKINQNKNMYKVVLVWFTCKIFCQYFYSKVFYYKHNLDLDLEYFDIVTIFQLTPITIV